MKAKCPDCTNGTLLYERPLLENGEIVVVAVHLKCFSCKGSGWVPFPGNLLI